VGGLGAELEALATAAGRPEEDENNYSLSSG